MDITKQGVAEVADVIVIGAGVLGTFHAYFAAQKGYKTLLLERNALPNDASTRNFGMIVQTIVEAEGEWADYARQTREIYQTVQQELDISMRRSGSLYIASTEIERSVLHQFAEMYGQVYHCEYLSADEACYRYRFIKPSYCTGALFSPDDLTIEPRQLLRRFIPHIVHKHGIDYRPGTTVVTVEQDGQGCRVRDARGNVFVGKQVFVCSGAEYRTLFPERIKDSGLQVCKLQMMETVALPEKTLPHSILSGLSIERYPAFKGVPAYQQLQQQAKEQSLVDYGIHLLFKQAADGSIVIGDSHEYSSFQDASAKEEYTNYQINAAILGYAQRMLDLPNWNIQKMWNGYYLQHPQLPIYTEQVAENITIVTGIAGKGMSTGAGFVRRHIDALLG